MIEVNKTVKVGKITFSNATNTKNGINIYLNSIEDLSIPQYLLVYEKTAWVVIKSTLVYMKEEKLKEELKENNMKTTEFMRMIRRFRPERRSAKNISMAVGFVVVEKTLRNKKIYPLKINVICRVKIDSN